MPELPEAEVTRRTLLKFIENKVIKNIKINNPNLRFKIPVNFKKNLTGQKIIKVLRRSKYILIYLKNDYVMIAHLGMSGKFIIKNNYSKDFLKTSYYSNEFSSKHNHLEFLFSNDLRVIYNDPRRFGFFLLDKISKLHVNKFLSKLGPEPLSKDLKKDLEQQIIYYSNLSERMQDQFRNDSEQAANFLRGIQQIEKMYDSAIPKATEVPAPINNTPASPAPKQSGGSKK
jgi:formamidopyrimidine-DNA glycosylase